MTLHICPVCGKAHEVAPSRQSVAWGRQLSCSCDCEKERRRRVRRRLLDGSTMDVQTGVAEYTENMSAMTNHVAPARMCYPLSSSPMP
jgi:hypothetical protein